MGTLGSRLFAATLCVGVVWLVFSAAPAGAASAITTPLAAATYDYDRLAANARSAVPSAPRASMRADALTPMKTAQQSGGARSVEFLAAKAGAGAAGRLSPAEIRFSQDSIRSTFRSGGSIDDLAQGLRSGRIDPGDVPPIRVVERDGLLFSLDNRRLAAFQRAGVDVPYRFATPEEIASEAYKFTTRNAGVSIRIRGG